MIKFTKFVFTGLGICCFMLCMGSLANAQQTVTTPRISQAAEVSQTIGLTKITINYSRPSVRKRKIWGGLVPYGFQQINFGAKGKIPWRAGANENTVFTTTHALKIGSKTLPPGTYGFHIVVGKDGNNTIIFSKNSKAWGSYFYKPNEDVLRAEAKTSDVPMHVENLLFIFEDVTKNTAVVSLFWGKKKISFPLEVDVNNIVLASMKRDLTSLPGFNWQGPMSAASYLLANNMDLAQALKWTEQSIQAQSNFQNNSLKAQILMRQGKKTEAVALLDNALPLGNVNQIHQLGRQLIRNKMPEKALEFFKFNHKKIKTQSLNTNQKMMVNYGLMRGYSAIKEYKKAIKYGKAALKNLPANNTAGKTRLEAMIKKLEQNQDIN